MRFRARHLILSLCIGLAAAAVSAQPVSYQGWQSATIASGAITVTCYELLLPHIEGSLLSEPSPTSTCGEMCQSLSSAHPVKIALTAEGGGPTDSLTTISGCTLDGGRVTLSPVSGDTITIVDGSGIELPDDVNIVMDTPQEVCTLQRKDGNWILESCSGGLGGSGGGDLTIADGATLSFADPSSDDANEGFFPPRSTSCANFIGTGQMCVDTDDQQIYFGNGTGIDSYSGGSSCTDSVDCFNNSVINIQTTPFTALDDNNDGFVMDINAGGPRLRCMTDYGGGGEAECTPSEIKTVSLLPGAFSVDATQCVRNFDVTINAETVPVTITCADSDSGVITAFIPMPDRFDGTNLVVYVHLHSNEATPAGDLFFDWRAYCVETNEASGTNSYPSETSNGEMTIDLDSLGGTDRAVISATTGDIPMSGCSDSGKKGMWLRAELDATGTTADNLTDQHIIGVSLEYGLKAYTD